MAPDFGLTLKLTSLPLETTESDVRRYLREFPDMKDKYIKKVSEPCPYSRLAQGSLGSVVTLRNRGIAQKLYDHVRRDQRNFHAERGGGYSTVVIDSEFLDLTTLYSSTKGPGGKPTVDIIGVHGLSGHGYNSWVYLGGTDKDRIEVMWLKDVLPGILENEGIYPRIMVYGYRSNIFTNTNAAKLVEPSINLYNCLNAARHDTNRPLYFFGHSIGGIIIKQTVCIIDENAASKSHPVRGCVFFGTPHRGSASAETARAFLTLLALFTLRNQGNANIVVDIQEKSQALADINGKFLQVRHRDSIGVLSCFEQVNSYNGQKIVTEDSARLDFPTALPPFPIDANHSDMVKFASSSHQGFDQVISALLEIMTRPPPRLVVAPAISRPARIHDPHAGRKRLENKLRFLSKYDTVFMIDDSTSMGSWEDENDPTNTYWTQTRDIFLKLVPLAIQHDRDGIDIQFLNATWYNEENVKWKARVEYLFNEVQPDGTTPIGFELEGYLKNYLRRLEKDMDLKPLNLIVITDGAPDDYEEMEKAIVGAAQKVQQLGARDRQIGIQFVQIGNEDEATKFLKRLDDDLGRNNKTLDIVDTVKYDPDGGEEMIMKILLGAIKDEYDHQPAANGNGSNVGSRPVGLASTPALRSSAFEQDFSALGLTEMGSNSRRPTGFGQR
ncbi:hypothetical protein FGG08_001136 [Glutinoglossum americanum]|uniref:VWFA domain-containing protein n=1 Tax=Glutinoglossum americanum TaxID=1670608 RepID=A0A9P8L5L6_9PEZI|nr:hypothetical protein FGG08_001136 [Glutinoglossum americanum]